MFTKILQSSLEVSTEEAVPKLAGHHMNENRDRTLSDATGFAVEDKLPPKTVEKLFDDLKIQNGELAETEAPAKQVQGEPVDASFQAPSDAATNNDIFSTEVRLPATPSLDTHIGSTITGVDKKEVGKVQQKPEDAEGYKKPVPTVVHDSDVCAAADVPITESPTDNADVPATPLEVLDRLQPKDTPDLDPNSVGELLDTVDPKLVTPVMEDDKGEYAEEGRKGYSEYVEQRLRSETPDETYDIKAPSPGVQCRQALDVSCDSAEFSTHYGINRSLTSSRPTFREPTVNSNDSLLIGTGITKTGGGEGGLNEGKKDPLTLAAPSSPSASALVSPPRSPVKVFVVTTPEWTDEVRDDIAACLKDPAKKRVAKYLRAKYRQVGAIHILHIVYQSNWQLGESEKMIAELDRRIFEGELVLETSE